MAIYRPTKPRWPAALASGVIGIAVGLIAGSLLASGDPDLEAISEDIRAALRGAAASLEVAEIEYTEAIEGGSETELGGSRDALASSRARYEEVAEGLRTLAPERAATIEVLYDRLGDAMSSRSPVAEVAGSFEELEAELTEP